MSLWRAALLVLQKDLEIELRTGEVTVPTGLFATLVTLLASLSFFIDENSARLVARSSMIASQIMSAASSGVIVGKRSYILVGAIIGVRTSGM